MQLSVAQNQLGVALGRLLSPVALERNSGDTAKNSVPVVREGAVDTKSGGLSVLLSLEIGVTGLGSLGDVDSVIVCADLAFDTACPVRRRSTFI